MDFTFHGTEKIRYYGASELLLSGTGTNVVGGLFGVDELGLDFCQTMFYLFASLAWNSQVFYCSNPLNLINQTGVCVCVFYSSSVFVILPFYAGWLGPWQRLHDSHGAFLYSQGALG